jgi:hypothetical protein
MALIGDIITSVRNKIPDLSTTLPAPILLTVTPINGDGTVGPGTIYVIATYTTPWGETAPSNELTATISAPNNTLTITTTLGGWNRDYGIVTGVNVYIGGGQSGNEVLKFSFPGKGPADTLTLSSIVPVTYQSPPSRSTAYLPDSDGPQFGASTLYLWLNEALAEFSRIVGGILDYAGVPTVAGQPMYVCPGTWLSITDVWYGGYWVKGGQRAEFFRRNSVLSSILSRVTISVNTDQQVIEVGYQPDRSSGVTATTASMVNASDSSVAIANPGAFLLPFGFAQFSGPLGTEIVAYSSLLGTMSGLIRSLGSTVAQVWPSGTMVTELSLFWCGKRTFGTKYSPGQGQTVLQAPHGWGSILPIWMLAQAKKAEQDIDGAMKLEKQFSDAANEWYRSNKGVASRVQVGGNYETPTFSNTVAGGVIIPGP